MGPPARCRPERPRPAALGIPGLADPDRHDVAGFTGGGERFVVGDAQIIAEPDEGERVGGHDRDYCTVTVMVSAVDRRDSEAYN